MPPDLPRTRRSPDRILIPSGTGFDQFFVELAALVSSGQASPQAIGALNPAYGLQVDPDGTASIAAEHRLVTALPQ
jgi:hypothetical protein